MAGLGGERAGRYAMAGMIIALVLVIMTIFLIQAPAEEMMDGLEDIANDENTADERRLAMLENEIEEYNKSLLLPKLPMVFAGMVTLITVIIQSRDQLKGIRKSFMERIRGNLRS